MTDGSLVKYCSPKHDPDGPVCAHGAGVLMYSHWGCCGERVRESMACCPPGGASNRHTGRWKPAAADKKSVCAVDGACTHKPDIDMVRGHWSCCADINRASDSCLEQPTHAHTHPGDWRPHSTERWDKHCSPKWDPEGRVCTHAGGVITTGHWTCCGDLLRSSAACGSAPHGPSSSAASAASSSADSVPGAAGPWQCPACTFRNDAGDACQMCDGRRPAGAGAGDDGPGGPASDADQPGSSGSGSSAHEVERVDRALRSLAPHELEMFKSMTANGSREAFAGVVEHMRATMSAEEFANAQSIVDALTKSTVMKK